MASIQITRSHSCSSAHSTFTYWALYCRRACQCSWAQWAALGRTSVDQHRQGQTTDGHGPTSIQARPGAPCEQDVVHQDHMPLFHREIHGVLIGRQGLLVGPEVVPEERHVELPTIDLCAWKQFLQSLFQAFGQSRTPRLEPHQIGV